jgi:O-antigen/teichoic acid export membrane protein
MASYAERLARGGSIIFLGGLLAAVLGYSIRIFLARNMSVSDFGLFYAVGAFIGFFQLFNDLGLGQAMIKSVPELESKKNFKKLKSMIVFSSMVQIVMGIVIFAFLMIFADNLAADFFHNSGAANVIRILGIEFLVGFTIFRCLIQGAQKFGFYSMIETMRIGFVAAFVVSFAVLTASTVAMAYLFAGIIMNFVLVFYSIRIYRSYPKAEIDFGIAKENLIFGLTLLAGGIAGAIISFTDVLAVTFFRSVNEVALYQAALPTSQILWIFATSLGAITLPLFSEIWAKGQKDVFGKGIAILIKLGFTLMIPLAAVILAFPDVILNLLFGSTYVGASLALQILCIAAIFYTVFSLLLLALISIGKAKTVTKITFIMAAVNLILNIILVPLIGFVGSAIATLTVFIVGFVISYSNIRKDVQLHTNLRYLALLFIGGIITAASVYIVKSLFVYQPLMVAGVSAVIGFGLYTLFVIKTKAITKNDIELLSKTNIPLPRFLMRAIARVLGA